MDEATGSDVNPHVIHVSRVHAEEHQIARRQLGQRHGPRRIALLSGRTRNIYACVFVRVHGKAAAVEPEFVGAAEVIGSSNQTAGDLRDLRPAQILNGRRARRVSRTRRKQ
jgi:hypothetical protein